MKRVCLFLSIVALALGKNVPDNITPASQAEKNNDFNIETFNGLRKDSHSNVVFSGFSLHKVLSLISLGAKGKTAEQLKKVLRLDGTDEEIKNGYKAFTEQMEQAEHITMETAVKAYLAEGLPIEPEMEKTATHYFHSGIENVDFNKAKETAAHINNWVEKQTHDKIKNLIKEDNIGPLTRFILVNTLYFKGEFKHPFENGATEKDDFHISKTENVKVDMMKLSANILLGENKEIGVKMISLPYRNTDAQLVILLPDDIDKTDAVEQNIMKIWHSKNFTRHYVKVSLPRFRVESSVDMIPVLKEMGITELFSAPDLSGITKDDIVVTAIKQKTYVDVNELGTEAASATFADGVIRAGHIPRDDAVVFKVNRPFVFGILYDGVCLLAGRVHKP